MKRYRGSLKFVLQQDNCGPHRDKSVKANMNIQNLDAMKGPSQILDLNLIEELRVILK